MKINSTLLAALLLMGVVDQISDSTALIEYENHGKIFYSHVSLDISACRPEEGLTVHFFKDYIIVSCEED